MSKISSFSLIREAPKGKPERDLCVLTRTIDEGDPSWNLNLTLVDSLEELRKKFDLSAGVPYGWRLLKGKAAQRFLKHIAREELHYRREQQGKRRCAGQN